ncbi:MAG TPA: CsbD family protein [Mycobacteriales bacterium]|nr:CsbD family protein [Mycobacteriales bacterium]
MGVFEEAKGKMKEAAGNVLDEPKLKAEGEAQQTKGAEQRRETETRAEAQAHEAKAEIAETEQQAAQDS